MLKKTLALLTLVAVSAANAGTSAPSGKAAPAISPTITPEEISYSNLSISWLRQWGDFTNIDVDGNGIAAAVEYSPVNNLYVAAGGSWSDLEFSVPGASVSGDYWTLNAGVGGYIPLTSNIHFVTEVGASYGELDIGGPIAAVDGWGLYVTPHFRAKFGAIEAHLGVTYNSGNAAISEWSTFARLLYEVCPSVDLFVTGTYAIESEFDNVFGLNVGLRYKF
jgi:hypothetical protein